MFIFSTGVTSLHQGLVEGGSCRDETHLLSARPTSAFALSQLWQSPDHITVLLNQTDRKIQTILFPLSVEQSKCLSERGEENVPPRLQKGPQLCSAPALNVSIVTAPTQTAHTVYFFTLKQSEPAISLLSNCLFS